MLLENGTPVQVMGGWIICYASVPAAETHGSVTKGSRNIFPTSPPPREGPIFRYHIKKSVHKQFPIAKEIP